MGAARQRLVKSYFSSFNARQKSKQKNLTYSDNDIDNWHKLLYSPAEILRKRASLESSFLYLQKILTQNESEQHNIIVARLKTPVNQLRRLKLEYDELLHTLTPEHLDTLFCLLVLLKDSDPSNYIQSMNNRVSKKSSLLQSDEAISFQNIVKQPIFFSHPQQIKQNVDRRSTYSSCEVSNPSESVNLFPVTQNMYMDTYENDENKAMQSSFIWRDNVTISNKDLDQWRQMLFKHVYYSDVSSSELLRDILNPLQGLDGNYIKYNASLNAYLIDNNIQISSPVRILTTRICQLGVHYRRLLKAIDNKEIQIQYPQSWMESPSNNGFQHPLIEFPPSNEVEDLHTKVKNDSKQLCQESVLRSRVVNAFTQFIGEQLTQYYYFLALLETEITNPEESKLYITNLRSLSCFLQEPSERMSMLAALYEVTQHLSGGPFLSVLYDHAQRIDCVGMAFSELLLNHVCKAWLEFVYDWIEKLEIIDNNSEFFIKSPNIKNITNAFDNYSLETLWHSTFEFEKSRIPSFIGENICKVIYFCGKTSTILAYFRHYDRLRGSQSLSKSNELRSNQSFFRKLTDSKTLFTLNDNYNFQSSKSEVELNTIENLNSELFNSENLNSQNIIYENLISENSKIEKFNSATADHAECSDYATSLSPSQKRRYSEPSHEEIVAVLTSMNILVDTELPAHLPITFDFMNDTSQDYSKFYPTGFIKLDVLEDMYSTIPKLNLKKSYTAFNLILHKYHLLSHCEAIRRFLLFIQGDFILELFSLLGAVSLSPSKNSCNLSKSATELTGSQLDTCLQLSISSSNAQYFQPKFLNRLSICQYKDCSHIIGWESIYFDYYIKDDPVSLILDSTSFKAYHTVHTLLYKVQITVYHLNSVWMNRIRKFRSSCPVAFKKPSLFSDYSDEELYFLYQCEIIHHEMMHFLRCFQTFLNFDVLEASWLSFLYSIVQMTKNYNKYNSNTTQCLIDELISHHRVYTNSLVNNAFLRDSITNDPMNPRIILSETSTETSPALAHILHLLHIISQYSSAAATLEKSNIKAQSAYVNELHTEFTTSVIRFIALLKQLTKSSIEQNLSSKQPLKYTDAIRSFAFSLDFNKYYEHRLEKVT